ncbi:MAG: chemotaxis protein CheD [Caulobacteraceae bacterium]
MERVIGIGEYVISGNPEDKIITYTLASCVAVTAYSCFRKVAGMVHIILPFPSENREIGLGPCHYAITGIPLMINRMCSEYGCVKSELSVKLFGGADSIKEDDIFRLGFKNIETAKMVLENMELTIAASETGGQLSRTLEMDVATGIVMIKSQPIII